MKLQDVHGIATNEFALVPKRRDDGWSYWTDEGGMKKSVRVLRVSENGTGEVTEIKLPVSSSTAAQDVFLPPSSTLEQVRAAIAREIQGTP